MYPDVSMIHPMSTPQRPPIHPNQRTRRRVALASSALSNSNSRFFEPPYPAGDEPLADQSTYMAGSNSPYPYPAGSNSPYPNPGQVYPRVNMAIPNATSGFQRPPIHAQGRKEDNYEDVYKSIDMNVNHPIRKRIKFFVLVELAVLICLMCLLIASLVDYNLQNTTIWSLDLWKWCVLFTMMFGGRLIAKFLMTILVYLVERKLLFRKKVPYYANGLKRSVQVFLWLSSVLLAWVLLFIHGSNRSKEATEVLHYITKTLGGCLVGAVIWLVKTSLIKTLALSFHVKRFFDRVQKSIFHQYVIQMLSGPPFMEKVSRGTRTRNFSNLSLERRTENKGVKEEVINVEKLQKLNQENVSAWTMKRLINVVRRTKLSTCFGFLDLGSEVDGMVESLETSKEIKNEWRAKVAAAKIFNNVAKPGYEYIEEEDLLRFLKINELNKVLPLFDGYIETGQIKESALEKWVVTVYKERKSLAHSLDDTKTAVDELNILASSVAFIAIVIVWCLMMGFFTTKILVYVMSQLLLATFIFGDTLKTLFQGIIFVFVTHPFDVGDRCVIDGVQMVVEEMNILNTIFLRFDNEKISYPNSSLATKPISNFYRSPEMNDSVEFAISFSTTVEAIAALKDKIKLYIESKPQHWRPCHSVQLIDILDMNKIKMVLIVTHTINFQNIAEKNSRTSDLVLELKKTFEQLGITYHLLPQDVCVTYVSPASASNA